MWERGGGQGYVSSCKMGESNKIRLGVFKLNGLFDLCFNVVLRTPSLWLAKSKHLVNPVCPHHHSIIHANNVDHVNFSGLETHN